MHNLTTGLLVLFLISITSAAPATLATLSICPKDLRIKADNSFAKLVLYGDYGVSWPTNEKELSYLCSQFKPNENTVKEFIRKCTSGLPQQILVLVLRGAASMSKRFCRAGGGKDVFLHSVCGNSDQAHDHNCMHKYVAMTKNSLTLDDDTKLAGACCSYNEFEECIVGRLRKEPKCTSEAVVFFKRQIKSIAGDALDLTCSEYKSNPSLCTPILNKMKSSKQEGKSLLLPLVRVMESLS